MSEALGRLKNIGAQRIYEETHIPIEHVQAILHESFDGLTKVQFVGFISILEREYKEDLSSLKERGIEHFNELHGDDLEHMNDDGIFIAPTKNQNPTIIYILIAVAIFAVVAYISLDSTQEDENITVVTTENPIIEDVKKSIVVTDINETNSSLEQNSSLEKEGMAAAPKEKESAEMPQKSLPQTFKIVSNNTKVWVGYIELETNRKYQKTFEGELDLDPKKNWLIVLGHGYVDFIVGDEIKKFDPKKDVRFLYKDGELKPISKYEFIELNRGSSW